MFLFTFFSVISTIIVICIATPFFLSVMVPLGILYILVQVQEIVVVVVVFVVVVVVVVAALATVCTRT